MSTRVTDCVLYGARLDEVAAQQHFTTSELNGCIISSGLTLLQSPEGADEYYCLIGKLLAQGNEDDRLGQGAPWPIPVPGADQLYHIAKDLKRVFGIQQPLGLHFVAHHD